MINIVLIMMNGQEINLNNIETSEAKKLEESFNNTDSMFLSFESEGTRVSINKMAIMRLEVVESKTNQTTEHE
ncbi:hypothetical protein [Bacillus sp. T33-2]|uniref:hypothetical protein n=1 Tax=Bacillus sp. T33-2 TaxID=2054168 RepID=UPI000C792FB3|nr:hypothetical protein [Bacillus sp. T33-2]PLR93209.1 hypothetical protein CVD19_19590 [Bacillus sp. T33-2]